MLPAGGAQLTGSLSRPDNDELTAGRLPVLDVTIPVYNEERDLEPCVRRL